jgi:NADH-quinone oxidoreductase subunit E
VAERDFTALFRQFKGEEGDLIPLLQRIQEKAGYISEEAVEHIARFLKISENQIFGVASFYSQFRFTKPGRNSIKVCQGTACHVRGARSLCEALQKELGISPGETTEDKRFDLQRVACLGCCALSPVLRINEDIYSRMTVVRLRKILDRYE